MSMIKAFGKISTEKKLPPNRQALDLKHFWKSTSQNFEKYVYIYIYTYRYIYIYIYIWLTSTLQSVFFLLSRAMLGTCRWAPPNCKDEQELLSQGAARKNGVQLQADLKAIPLWEGGLGAQKLPREGKSWEAWLTSTLQSVFFLLSRAMLGTCRWAPPNCKDEQELLSQGAARKNGVQLQADLKAIHS